MVTQGKQIYLEGKLRTRSWQDREGNKRYTTEIEARNIILLGKKEEETEQEEMPKETAETETQDAPPPAPEIEAEATEGEETQTQTVASTEEY